MKVLEETRELAAIIDRHMGTGSSVEVIRPGLVFGRIEKQLPRIPALYRCALCVVAQGSKRVHVGEHVYTYDPTHYLVCTLTVPAESEIFVDQQRPLLSMVLELDMRRIGKLIADTVDDLEPTPMGASGAMCDAAVDRPMARALLRLAEAAQNDAEWRVLGKGAMREVDYRALTGPAGHMLRERVARIGTIEPVARAVQFIEEHLAEPLDVTTIAKAAAVSSSGLHARFKEVTAQSPMQYVKRLRLEHARRHIASGESVTNAAFRVGYASASQFSRDFRRQFGVPPSKVRPFSMPGSPEVALRL